MNVSQYLKPRSDRRPCRRCRRLLRLRTPLPSEEKDTPGQALVVVTKSTNACFSDCRVTGFIVPRREAQVNVDTEGSKVTDVFVREGDTSPRTRNWRG